MYLIQCATLQIYLLACKRCHPLQWLMKHAIAQSDLYNMPYFRVTCITCHTSEWPVQCTMSHTSEWPAQHATLQCDPDNTPHFKVVFTIYNMPRFRSGQYNMPHFKIALTYYIMPHLKVACTTTLTSEWRIPFFKMITSILILFWAQSYYIGNLEM